MTRRWLVAAAVGMVGVAATFAPIGSGSIAGASSRSNDNSAPSCGTDQVCVTIPVPGCAQENSCPEVIATMPPTGLADGEAVQLQLLNFPSASGDDAIITYCSDPAQLVYPPSCSSQNQYGTLQLPSTEVVAPQPAGTTVGYQIQSNPDLFGYPPIEDQEGLGPMVATGSATGTYSGKGNDVTLSGISGTIGFGALVTDFTTGHASYIPQGTYVTGVSGSTVTLSNKPTTAFAGDSLGFTPAFFCGAGPASQTEFPCSVDVVLGNLNDVSPPVMSADNTAVIPVSYFVPLGGCSSNTPTLTTEASWTMERLLPVADKVACHAPGAPAVAFDTSTDSEKVASDLAQGPALGVQMAFTDDPEDPVDQSVLASGKYALIPVALSATVMAVKGAIAVIPPSRVNTRPVVDGWNLTPNEVAGVLTGLYSHITNFDDTSADSICTQNEPGCNATDAPWCQTPKHVTPTCSVMEAINPPPPPYTAYYGGSSFELGDYFYAQASGTTAQVTDWFCKAPNSPLSITVNNNTYNWTDPNVAQQTFVENNNLDPGVPWPITACETINALGPDILTPPIPENPPQINTADSPADVATSMGKYTVNNEAQDEQNSNVAFGLMDSSESAFFGDVDASIQNADGQFFIPTEGSLDTALSLATKNPDGTLNFNYTTPNPGAYPMPMVTYAIVPTAPQPATAAAEMKSFLLSLLSVTGDPAETSSLPGGNNAKDLPPGYFPLTSSLFGAAVVDVTKDIHAAPAPPPTTSTTVVVPTTTAPASNTTTTTAASTSTTLAPGQSACCTRGSGPSATGGRAAAPQVESAASAPGASPTTLYTSHFNETGAAPTPASFLVGSAATRALIIGLLIAAVAALVCGPALLVTSRRSARRRASRG